MARRVFYSFEYKPDNWRASKVRQMGSVEGNPPATDNDWEKITSGGDTAIKRWIEGQLDGRSCAVVLIGSTTANRKWINHEIARAWELKKGLVGIHIHKIKDVHLVQSQKGANPFDYVSATINGVSRRLSSIVAVHDPGFSDSQVVYDHIKRNLASWIDETIEIRNRY